MTRNQRGGALILVLLLLVFLAAAGSALVSSSILDLRVNANFRSSAVSLATAEAALGEARQRILESGVDLSTLLLRAAAGDGVLCLGNDLETLLASDDQPLIPSAPGLRESGEAMLDGGGNLMGHYWVWLRNDVADVAEHPADSNSQATLLAIARTGNAQRVLELEIARASVPLMPAAVGLAGPLQLWSSPASTAFAIDGRDASGGGDVPGIGVLSAADAAVLQNNGWSGDVAVENTIAEQLRTTPGLERLARALNEQAARTLNPPPGTSADVTGAGGPGLEEIVAVNGDARLVSGNGYGILLCRGVLTIAGSFTWHGLILVIGQGAVHWENGSGEIAGALLVAHTREAQTRSAANPLGNLLAVPSAIAVDLAGAYGPGVRFDRQAIAAATRNLPLTVLSWTER